MAARTSRPPADALADARARFNALVLPHLDRLLSFARRRTADPSDAEDAVQEACVRAWNAFGDLEDPALVRPWLYQILRNTLSDAREKSARRTALVPITRLEDTLETLVSTESDVVFTEVAARIDRDALYAALAAIPDEFSRAVELHDIDGFKYAEIATIEGIPLGTVMSRISRGRRLLAGAIVEARSGAAHPTERRSHDRRTTHTDPAERTDRTTDRDVSINPFRTRRRGEA